MKRAIAATKAYHEYGYYDEENLTSGFIDLLFVEDGVYHIVDYKTSSIEDPAYDEQLNAYARNVMRLFNVDKDHVQLHLISIRGAKTRDVPVL
jgi:ATP-dependent exoDNAse (exonuclease V) beta subunit